MIIWINGAYGAGKTTIAELLQTKITNSYLYDPENIGDFFRKNLPKEIQKADFQDYPEWRAWNVHVLAKIDNEYAGDIIVPMTVYKQLAYDEIFAGLREAKVEVHHFQLEVSKETVLERLRGRSSALVAWRTERIDEIVEAFQPIPADEKINNEKWTPDEAVQQILARIYSNRDKLFNK